MTPDAELLHRFVAAQSNADFTELVRRHIDVVYHAALRRTNRRADLAADITQEVFTLLARKAAVLQGHKVLIGWLYTTTRHTANSVMRAERRRQQREQETHAMNSIDGPATDTTHLRQELDSILDQLSSSDREAILLRFFHNQDYNQIGAAQGLSDDAARKRVERALDRLRVSLARRGITSTAAALAALLTGEAALAAPAGLGTTVTSAALAAGTSVSLTSLFVAKFVGTKSAVAFGLACVAVFIAVSSNRRPNNTDATPDATAPLAAPVQTIATEPAPPTTPTAEIPPTPIPALPVTNLAPQPDLDKILPLTDNTFADDKYHVMGKLPDGWSILKYERWGKEETTISLRDPDHPNAIPNIYYQMFTEPMQPVDASTADSWLRKQATYKAKQRVRSGSSDYVNGEVISRTIGGQPAVTWTATYTRNGEPWAEYLTRVYSPDCTMLFTLRAPAADLPAMTPKFESVILTTNAPTRD